MMGRRRTLGGVLGSAHRTSGSFRSVELGLGSLRRSAPGQGGEVPVVRRRTPAPTVNRVRRVGMESPKGVRPGAGPQLGPVPLPRRVWPLSSLLAAVPFRTPRQVRLRGLIMVPALLWRPIRLAIALLLAEDPLETEILVPLRLPA